MQPVTPCLCDSRHPTFSALAACLWPDAAQVVGTGPYVLVSTQPGRIRPTVILYTWVDDALDAKLQLDEAGRLFKAEVSNRIHYLRPDAIERNTSDSQEAQA